MGLRDWVIRRLVKSSAVQRILFEGGQSVLWPSQDYSKYPKEAYLQNVIAYRSILEIAVSVALVDWYVMQRQPDGKMKEVDTHPIIDLIENPNQDEDFGFVLMSLVSFMCLSGNGYLERVKLETGGRNLGQIKEIYSHRPDRIKAKLNRDTGQLEGWEYNVNGRKHVFEIDPLTGQCDLLHLRLFHPSDDVYGAAPTQTAARSIDTHNEGTTWNMRLLQNQARPGMVFIVKGNMGDVQYERLKKDLRDKREGAMKAGKSFILEGEGADVKPYGFTPMEMDFILGNREKAREIALAYGVPPMLLGIPGDNTYSNYKEARCAFWESTVMFYIRMLQKRLSRFLFDPKERMQLTPDLDSIPALEPRRQEQWAKAKEANWLKVNEKRAMTGFEEVDGGDVILVSTTETPLEDLQAPPEEDPDAGGKPVGDEPPDEGD